MQTTLLAQLVEIGNAEGETEPSALFQREDSQTFRVPLSKSQAQELGKHIYTNCEVKVLITPDTQYRSSRKSP